MMSLTSRYAEVVQQSFVGTDRWVWPRKRDNLEASPDPRLMSYNLPLTVANLTLPTGRFLRTAVRSVCQNDVVLTCDDDSLLPFLGQAVQITILVEGREVSSQTMILHWCGDIYGDLVVAGFTVNTLPDELLDQREDSRRGQIRFPLDMPGAIAVGPGEDVFGRIMDYSLSGCRFLAEKHVPLDEDYCLTALMPTSAVELTLHPRWVLNNQNGFQLGCSLQPEQGVLLACRHHPAQTGFSYPLKPVIRNWTAESNFEDDLLI